MAELIGAAPSLKKQLEASQDDFGYQLSGEAIRKIDSRTEHLYILTTPNSYHRPHKPRDRAPLPIVKAGQEETVISELIGKGVLPEMSPMQKRMTRPQVLGSEQKVIFGKYSFIYEGESCVICFYPTEEYGQAVKEYFQAMQEKNEKKLEEIRESGRIDPDSVSQHKWELLFTSEK